MSRLWTPGSRPGGNGNDALVARLAAENDALEKKIALIESEARRVGWLREDQRRVAVCVCAWEQIEEATESATFDTAITLARAGILAGRFRVTGAYQPQVRCDLWRDVRAADERERQKAEEEGRKPPLPTSHVLFIDGDMGHFTAQNVIRMLDHGLPIVSGCYYRRIPPYNPVHVNMGEDGKARLPCKADELEAWRAKAVREVWGVGGGLLLAERKVLDALGDWPFRFLPMEWHLADAIEDYAKALDAQDGEAAKAAYLLMLERLDKYRHDQTPEMCRGFFTGEDIAFSVMSRRLGFKSYVDWVVQTSHISVKPITIADYIEAPSEDRSLEGAEVVEEPAAA